MAAEEVGGGCEGGGDEASSLSPRSRVKFCCTYGGKILPRPSDGVLKYVGGETRVVAVPRNITFSGLMKKVSSLFEGDFVLKYQIASEDLDALVSVKSDEDLCHMFEEYDRLENEGNSKLRSFLFPPKTTVIETSQNPFSAVQHSPEQRFVDALNGIVRTTKPPLSVSRLKSVSSSPSESSSPHSISPNGGAHNSSMNSEASFVNSLQTKLTRMHKVQSSPSLCSLGSYQNNNTQLSNNHYRHNYFSPGHQHLHYHHACQSPYHTKDHQMHPPHSMVQPDFGKVATGHGHGGYNYSLHRAYPGSGGHNKWGHLGDYAAASVASVPAYGDGNVSRPGSLPR